MAVGYPDRLTKSHLSRIENGLAEPTFRRLYALSQIYGVPVTMLAERFELDLLTESVTEAPDPAAGDAVASIERLRELMRAGRHVEVIPAVERLIRNLGGESTPCGRETVHELSLMRASCLHRIERHELAKAELEAILDQPDLSARLRALAFFYLGAVCMRTRRYTVGALAIEQAQRIASDVEGCCSLRADILQLRGNFAVALERGEEAMVCYQEAAELYEAGGRRFERARTLRNLAGVYARMGKFQAARRMLVDVVNESDEHGFDRQHAYALSDLGMIAFREGQLDVCESYCLRSNGLARNREYVSIVFRNCFYLWRVAKVRQDGDAIRANLRSLRTYLSRVDEDLEERREFVEAMEEGL